MGYIIAAQRASDSIEETEAKAKNVEITQS